MIVDAHYKATIERNRALRATMDSCELAEACMDMEPEYNGYGAVDAMLDEINWSSGALHELDEGYDLRRRMGVL